MKLSNLSKQNLDTLKIWWNLAYKESDTAIYDKCETYCNALMHHLEIRKNRERRIGTWENSYLSDVMYIPEKYKDTNGIIAYYYTKDDIIRVCHDNKIVARYMYENLLYCEQFPEEEYEKLYNDYLNYFLTDKLASIYSSELSVQMYDLLSDEDKDKVKKVLQVRKTGRRKN